MDKVIKRLDRLTIDGVAFFQSFLLLAYITFVGLLMWKGNDLFGEMPSLLGPLLFLTLFSFSVMICGILTLGYPFVLFWMEKKPEKALQLVLKTALWLFIYFLIIFLLIVIF